MSNDIIDKEIKNITVDVVSENQIENQKAFKSFQNAAQVFLDTLNELVQKKEQTTSLIRNSKILVGLDAFKKDIREDQNFVSKALQAQAIFEHALDTFLGRVIYITYVFKDGSIYLIPPVLIQELYSKATIDKKRNPRGRLSSSQSYIKQLNNIAKENDKNFEALQNEIDKSAQLRKDIFQQACRRWGQKMNYIPSPHSVYWHTDDNGVFRWNKIQDPGGHTGNITRGHIAQAFVNAVIQQDENIINAEHHSAAQDSAVKALCVNHLIVENIPGGKQGDIIWDNDGKIQLAVKFGKPSTAGIIQFISLAVNIVNISELTLNDLKNNLSNYLQLSKLPEVVYQKAKQIATEKIQQQITKIIT